jgi:hypothetical protein
MDDEEIEEVDAGEIRRAALSRSSSSSSLVSSLSSSSSSSKSKSSKSSKSKKRARSSDSEGSSANKAPKKKHKKVTITTEKLTVTDPKTGQVVLASEVSSRISHPRAPKYVAVPEEARQRESKRSTEKVNKDRKKSNRLSHQTLTPKRFVDAHPNTMLSATHKGTP